MRRTGPGGFDDLFDTLKGFGRKKDPHAGMDTGNIDDQNGGGNNSGNNGGKRFRFPTLRIPAGLIVIVLLAAYLSQGCWYSLDEDNYAVVMTLGNAETVSQAGLHFKLPIIQRVRKVSKPRWGRSSRSPRPRAGAWASRMSKPLFLCSFHHSFLARRAIWRSVCM